MKKLFLLAGVLILALSLLGCSDDYGDDPIIVNMDLQDSIIVGDEEIFKAETANFDEDTLTQQWLLEEDHKLGNFQNQQIKGSQLGAKFIAQEEGEDFVRLIVKDKSTEIYDRKPIEILSRSFQNTYGGSGADGFHAVVTTEDNGYLASGYFQAGFREALAVKADHRGREEWKKRIGDGRHNHRFNSVEAITEGTFRSEEYYFLIGHRGFTGDRYEGYVIKLNEAGNKEAEFANFLLNDQMFFRDGIFVDDSLIVVGNQHIGNNEIRAYIVKIDPDNGNILRQKSKDLSSAYKNFTAIKAINNGYIVVGEDSSKQGIVIELDENFNLQKERRYGSKLYGLEITDDGYIVVGEKDGAGYYNLLDKNLNLRQNAAASRSETSIFRDVIELDNGGYLLVGGHQTKDGNGCITKVYANGNYAGHKIYNESDRFDAISKAEDGYFVAGRFKESDSSGTDYNAYLIKIDQNFNILKR